MATKKTNAVNKNMSANNETKVMCPVCGTEFAIGEHEHAVKNVIAVGKDSGLGEVYLPVSKRGAILQAAGVDASKYFSVTLPTGKQQLMKMSDDGVPVAVTESDPIIASILAQGTVPNRNLFRRWIMSQVFHGLNCDLGFNEWLVRHGYKYQWKMIVEELRVQAKLYGNDPENFQARNRWFNKDLVLTMAKDYLVQLHDAVYSRPRHKCKGVPYVKFGYKNIFVSDLDKKILQPIRSRISTIRLANTPKRLYEYTLALYKNMPLGFVEDYHQCQEWKDAYKGMGAYATMQNLLRFHGCTFPKDNAFYDRRMSDLEMLEDAAQDYSYREGWRLFGLMKQMIEENGIDIAGKMKQWAAAKRLK